MTYETVILKNVPMSELDNNLLRNYFSNLNVVSDNPSKIILEALGIVGQTVEEDYHPTIGGLLLFGKNPSIYLPHVYIKVTNKKEVKMFYGSILNMLDEVSDYLKSVINNEKYPFEALEEVIANALVHRDYLDNSRGITISITDKNIEISNPGALIAENSVYKFIKENNPNRRNSWLYQRLLTLDPKKRFMKSGMGMTRIKTAFRDIGKVKFVNIGSQNLFKVLLPPIANK
jgi:predicted HTH transcriptional regulator